MPRTNSGRRILTAPCSTPVIPDNLLLAAAATFARQLPRTGPPADVLANSSRHRSRAPSHLLRPPGSRPASVTISSYQPFGPRSRSFTSSRLKSSSTSITSLVACRGTTAWCWPCCRRWSLLTAASCRLSPPLLPTRTSYSRPALASDLCSHGHRPALAAPGRCGAGQPAADRHDEHHAVPAAAG